jgi:hypothetical protein
MTLPLPSAGKGRRRSLAWLGLGVALGMALSPLGEAARARLGLGGGIGVGRWGSGVGFGGVHPVFGVGVRPAYAGVAPAARFYDRPYAAFHPAWVSSGFWAARPWAVGWYRVNPVAWSWWAPRASTWGITGLATAATISSLVNQAVAQQSGVIVVPQTSFQLNFASVEAVGSQGASFFYGMNDGPQLFGGANCALGLVDGQPPASAAEAQLLNAVCQVAYGPGA